MVWEFHIGIPTALLVSCRIAGDKHATAGCALESSKRFREHPSQALRGGWSSPLTHVPLRILLSGPWSSSLGSAEKPGESTQR